MVKQIILVIQTLLEIYQERVKKDILHKVKDIIELSNQC